MSVSETSNISRMHGAWRASRGLLRLEKPSKSAALDGERRESRERASPRTMRSTVSRFGTEGSPVPAYAAQVIGQALDAHEKPSVRAAYRGLRAQIPHLLDLCS